MEAGFGLGEGLVYGLVNADAYKVRNGEVVAKAVATKQESPRTGQAWPGTAHQHRPPGRRIFAPDQPSADALANWEAMDGHAEALH